ncbi:hypothetical protein CCAX7_29730 [Capsulimonas corticalis]|uniref:Uncharacterized protein n=1 Tax=Capsulimonas corticalis TaxID=2219043 RepID=A0A402CSZ2_9BACT|nr:hypothetical protein [Capsulimonas corticalis]BDI30922.1 hypothetical protein CCAX7_29730 [Capsulimonas corticalis]
MFLRFVVHQKIDKAKFHVGLFAASSHLQEYGELSIYEWERLEELLKWFNTHLPLPNLHQENVQAVYWYRASATMHIAKMWEIAGILQTHGYDVEMVKTEFAGLIIYRDDFQIGAIPKIDRH